jgi:uncharacterized SAM-dependent methyltransferase
MLLEKGLNLYEAITHLEEYYVTNVEIEILEIYADKIATCIPAGCSLVDLGSG